MGARSVAGGRARGCPALGLRAGAGAVAIAIAIAIAGCGHLAPPPVGTVTIPAGAFQMGSDLDERARALEVAYAAQGGVTPQVSHWVKAELPATTVKLATYHIMQTPVTQQSYHVFVAATGRAEPWIDPSTWARADTGLPYEIVEKVAWRGGAPQPNRVHHPAVLVNEADAAAFCRWWGAQHGGVGRLPTEAEWERAARGDGGRAYPWGELYEPVLANGREGGPGDTTPVGRYEEARSPFGMLDAAGNVFEWTLTPADPDAHGEPRDGQRIVKGGAYSSDGSTQRAAARHARPAALRHPAIGFRCVWLPAPPKRERPPARSTRG
jgi:formylglycine-generating enzyme required for sulfatase activity